MRCTIVQSADYTPYITVLIPAILAIIAYFAKNYVFDPIRSFRAICWQADANFTLRQNVLCNRVKTDTTEQAKMEMRQLAGTLKTQYKQIPIFAQKSICEFKMAKVPTADAMDKVFRSLIGMSNRPPSAENSPVITELRDLLIIND